MSLTVSNISSTNLTANNYLTSDASGTDTAGTAQNSKAGASTGNAAGGSHIFSVTPAGSAGSSVNSFSTVLTMDSTKLSTFTGRVITDDATQSTNATSGSIQTDGGLGVVKNTNLGGTLVVTGASTLTGAVALVGATTITGAVDANSTGDFSGTLTCSNGTTGLEVTNNATVGGTLVVSGATTQTGTLVVTGASTHTGAMVITGAVDAASTGDFLGTLTCSAASGTGPCCYH